MRKTISALPLQVSLQTWYRSIKKRNEEREENPVGMSEITFDRKKLADVIERKV